MRHRAHRPGQGVSSSTREQLHGVVELTLLSTTKLLDLLLLVHHLGVERNADAYADIVVDAILCGLLIRVLGLLSMAIGLALDDEPTMASWDKALKNLRETLRDALERPLDGHISRLVKMSNEFFDGGLGSIKLLSSLEQLLLLCGEAIVLLEGLLVDMPVLLQGFVDFLESRSDLMITLVHVSY